MQLWKFIAYPIAIIWCVGMGVAVLLLVASLITMLLKAFGMF